jgi:hypothetical protein
MELKLNTEKINIPPERLLKLAGYTYIIDRNTGKESFVRSFGRGGYPRFHIYLKTEPGKTTISLHLDQKKPSYKGTSAHSGEYEGSTVEAEIERLKGEIKRIVLGGS